MDTNSMKYTFSSHESFPCKTLWLKKGYDFVKKDLDFNAPETVIISYRREKMIASIPNKNIYLLYN